MPLLKAPFSIVTLHTSSVNCFSAAVGFAVGFAVGLAVGFAVGFARSLSTEETFRLALAVSAASALSLFTGDFDPKDYDRLYPEVSIDRIA